MAVAIIKSAGKTWLLLAGMNPFHNRRFQIVQPRYNHSQLVNLFIALTRLLLLNPLSAAAQRNNLDERLQQAATLIRDPRIAEAEQQLNSTLKLASDEAPALNLLGTIRASQGKLDEEETRA